MAAVFSEGYLLPVEHFFFFEPHTPLYNPEPYLTVQSPLYALFGSYFRQVVNIFSINEPALQAFLLRLIHALFNIMSLIIGYRLALLAGSVRGARLSFALMALSWLMPFLSVRTFSFNLALPFLLAAVWVARYSLFSLRRTSLLAGMIASMAIMLYPPILVFWVPYVIITFLLGKPIRFAALIVGTLIGIELLHLLANQSLILRPVDWVPLLQMTGLKPWDINGQAFKALFILGLVLGPPLGFFVIYGFFRLQKYTLRMSLPAIFCLAASIFSVDPLGLLVAAFPFVVITGSQSWMEIVENHMKPSRQLSYFAAVGYFWLLNGFLLIWFSAVAPRKQELEAMRYIGQIPEYHVVWIEQTSQPNLDPLPMFYCGRKMVFSYIRTPLPSQSFYEYLMDVRETACIVFRGEEELKNRLLNAYTMFPALSFEAVFRPGMTEKFFRNILGWPSGTLVIYHNDYFRKKRKP